jgi:thymidine kinase
MEKNTLSVDALEAFIEESLQMYVADESNTMITDIHLQLKPETGGVVLLNDEYCFFSEAIIEEWRGLENAYVVAEQNLRDVLTVMRDSSKLDSLKLLKPYSFVLIDERKETIAELLIVDEQDTLFLYEGLLKGLDEELDEFLNKLLEHD